MAIPGDIRDREIRKFVESPTRADQTAVEVVGSFSSAPSAFNAAQEVVNTFDSVSSVAQNVETTVASYSVPAGKQFALTTIQVSGTNIATYNVYLGLVKIAVVRTMFGSTLTETIPFSNDSGLGFLCAAGETVAVKVIHPRSSTGDFDGRILGVLADV